MQLCPGSNLTLCCLFVHTDALAVVLHVSAEQDSVLLQVCNPGSSAGDQGCNARPE